MARRPSRPASLAREATAPVPPWLQAHAEGSALRIAVVPNAARSGLAGVHGDALRVRVAAVPVDGRANDALIAFLAERLGLPRRALRIDAGHGARVKRVVVALPQAQLLGRLQPRLDEDLKV